MFLFPKYFNYRNFLLPVTGGIVFASFDIITISGRVTEDFDTAQMKISLFTEILEGFCGREGNYDIEDGVEGCALRGKNEFMETNVELFAVWGAQRGDQEACRDLFEWHFEPVYRYCLNLASGRLEMAEEIAQQAFMTAAAVTQYAIPALLPHLCVLSGKQIFLL
jgi:hypothetical protein